MNVTSVVVTSPKRIRINISLSLSLCPFYSTFAIGVPWRREICAIDPIRLGSGENGFGLKHARAFVLPASTVLSVVSSTIDDVLLRLHNNSISIFFVSFLLYNRFSIFIFISLNWHF